MALAEFNKKSIFLFALAQIQAKPKGFLFENYLTKAICLFLISTTSFS